MSSSSNSIPIATVDPATRRLSNEELAPIPLERRTWTKWNIAALWVGMSVCIPTYMLASSLISGGMNWWQAVLTVFLGNMIVLVPMVLNAHAGTKYGISFPVFARASFGVLGANIPAILRAIVACGWFGIQTWIGGWAIYKLALAIVPALAHSPELAFAGINLAQFICFLLFWALNVWIFWRGMETIRVVEDWGAPLLLVIGVVLLGWAYFKAGGFGPMLGQPSKFTSNAEFWKFFGPGLTGMVGFWATLSLNIPDFTRMARSQKDQIVGQALGLNTTMPFYAFIGVAVTSATVVIFGETIWDPIELMSRFDNVMLTLVAMFALTLATLTTNLAANVVSPAISFSNLAPHLISRRAGGIITGLIGIVMMPWKLVADPSGYIFTWLIGYSALLGPIGGILIADYFVVRRTELNLRDLYRLDGEYAYRGGFNPVAIIALIVGILPNIPGFLGTIRAVEGVDSFWMNLYSYAWFTGFGLAFACYLALRKLLPSR
ncbi:MAG: NCS1 family nucleobase:cation symporter-1 [Candidatus Didemnitutus sp.]|nr:NCS1 family nucleobase:cation symporter-1 [Candidatus Didemnitutus sp.]